MRKQVNSRTTPTYAQNMSKYTQIDTGLAWPGDAPLPDAVRSAEVRSRWSNCLGFGGTHERAVCSD